MSNKIKKITMLFYLVIQSLYGPHLVEAATVLPLEKVRHQALSQYNAIPDYLQLGEEQWVLAIHYSLGVDDRYLDWGEITGTLKDRDAYDQETTKGWITVIDDTGTEWVQAEWVTVNNTVITSTKEGVNWREVDSDKIVSGDTIRVKAVWLHQVFDQATLPTQIYMNLYASGDVVMGRDYRFDHFDSRVRQSVVSEDGPEVTNVSIDGKAEGESWQSGDFVSSSPEISCDITDTDDSVTAWSLSLSKGGQEVYVVSDNISAATSFSLTHQVTEALTGTYQLTIQGTNGNGDLGERTATLVVDEGLQIKGLLTGPLPCDFQSEGGLTIDYQLSKAASVDIRIYDIAGEEQTRWSIAEGSSGGLLGFNRLTWNGVNAYGEDVANGPYVLYMKASNGDESDTDKSKIVVLR